LSFARVDTLNEVKKTQIPLVPVPFNRAKMIGERFRNIGGYLARPQMETYLRQAEIEMNAAEFMGVAIFTGIFYGLLAAVLVTALAYSSHTSILFGPLAGLLVFLVAAGSVSTYPRLVVIRTAKATDREMLGAMRHLLIEVRSGVPLFNGMVGITRGYGRVSQEFDRVVRDINAGAKEMDALNRAAERNTSMFFRRAVWQIVNAMRSGSDIGDTMEAITDSFTKSQAVRIRQYGQELNPWTMMYMIIAVIVPSLGITFLIVLSSFAGITIPPLVFPLIIVFLILFQVFFMGFIKNKRPNVTV